MTENGSMDTEKKCDFKKQFQKQNLKKLFGGIFQATVCIFGVFYNSSAVLYI